MARFDKHEKRLLVEICQKYPIVTAKGYYTQIINEKRQAWVQICEEFNALNQGNHARDCSQLRGLWKRLKLRAKTALDDSRKEARRSGGGPLKPVFGDAAEAVVARMLVTSCKRLEKAHGDPSVNQEGPGFPTPTIINNNVNGSQEEENPRSIMETNEASSSSDTTSIPVMQKSTTEVKKKNNYEEKLHSMARIEHGAKMKEHALKMQILQIKKQTVLLEFKKLKANYNIKIGNMDFDDLNWEKTNYNPTSAYGRSKLANIMFTKELAKRLEGTDVNTYTLHPGAVATELGRHYDTAYFKGVTWLFNNIAKYFIKSPLQGAQTTIYCAVSEKAANESGYYYSGCSKYMTSRQAQNPELAKRLWEESIKLVGLDNWDPITATETPDKYLNSSAVSNGQEQKRMKK